MTNLIFLALSLLHSEKPSLTSDIKRSIFLPPTESGEEKGESKVEGIRYFGQMDPIVIWKASQYKEDNLIVVALCTEKVLCAPYSSEDPVTSAEFFMTNVCEAADKELDLSSYCRKYMLQEVYSADGKIKFLLIPVNEDDLYPGIRDSVTAIRNWNKMENRGKFWIDVHGGFRSTMTVLSGIITLLKIDGIVPDKVYSPRFDNTSRTMTLPGSSEEIEIFDFVSGMDDFINYGNADMLRKYFGRHKASDYEKNVLGAIEKVAVGTQCCDTQFYYQGLDELAHLLNEPKREGGSLLGLFFDYIEESYGKLLTAERTTLMLVRRCVDKKLYQQALTFIEASMPEEIVAKGLLTFGESNYQLENIKNYARKADKDYYLFDAYLKMGGLFPTRSKNTPVREPKTLKESAVEWVGQEEKLRTALTGAAFPSLSMDTYVNTTNRNNVLPFDKEKQTSIWGLPEKIRGINSKVPYRDRKILGVFLRLHQLLKLCRNAFNHSLEERPDLPELLTLFELYIAYAEYLYNVCG